VPAHLPWPGAVTATRIGRAGRPGAPAPGVKFVIDFAGGALASVTKSSPLKADITTTRGAAKLMEVVHVEETGNWRMEFDLLVPGPQTVDLRAYLHMNDEPLTETWLYRLEPTEWAAVLELDG
jgi:glucans biosynthesis protein